MEKNGFGAVLCSLVMYSPFLSSGTSIFGNKGINLFQQLHRPAKRRVKTWNVHIVKNILAPIRATAFIVEVKLRGISFVGFGSSAVVKEKVKKNFLNHWPMENLRLLNRPKN